MRVEWDSQKAASNLKKHGIDFADATTVLFDDMTISIVDDATGEKRFVALGMDALARVLVLVYTWREDCIRIIPVRKANPRERGSYKGNL
jgi:uncharacterized DUF497 family protein